MKRNDKKSGVGPAIPRIAEYMRSSMGIIIAALILAALSAVMTIIGPRQDRSDCHADVGWTYRQH